MATLDLQGRAGHQRIHAVQSAVGRVGVADFPSTTSAQDSNVLFAIPKNSIITAVELVVTTAFNGTGAELTVGTSSDPDGFVTTTNFTPGVGTKSGSGSLLNATTGAADLPIHATLAWTAKPTAGEATLVVQYIEHSERAGSPNLGQLARVSV